MYVASGSADRSVRMWSITDGNTVRVLVGHRGTVLAVSFSPCGKYLASAGEDRRVKVWDVASSTTVHDYRGHNDVVHGLVWLSDALLASYSTDGSVRVWNTQQPSSSMAGASPNASCTDDFASYTVPAQWKPVSLAAGQRGSLVCIAASD
jgi:transcription initiation factor TFIID subunit 5